MNAWTGSDFTMYPFATSNEKDFNNLLKVYNDAVFFPLLSYEDFLQEACRLEFKEPGNPSSELEYKGVVFNEMKGHMANVDQLFIQVQNTHLMKGTPYQYNSGGDPIAIPKLTHDQLMDFHKKYHPSNATFLSYGDLDFTKHIKEIEEFTLASFDKAQIDSQICKAERRPHSFNVTHKF